MVVAHGNHGGSWWLMIAHMVKLFVWYNLTFTISTFSFICIFWQFSASSIWTFNINQGFPTRVWFYKCFDSVFFVLHTVLANVYWFQVYRLDLLFCQGNCFTRLTQMPSPCQTTKVFWICVSEPRLHSPNESVLLIATWRMTSDVHIKDTFKNCRKVLKIEWELLVVVFTLETPNHYTAGYRIYIRLIMNLSQAYERSQYQAQEQDFKDYYYYKNTTVLSQIRQCWKFGWNSCLTICTSVILQNCDQLSISLFHCISLHFKANQTMLNIWSEFMFDHSYLCFSLKLWPATQCTFIPLHFAPFGGKSDIAENFVRIHVWPLVPLLLFKTVTNHSVYLHSSFAVANHTMLTGMQWASKCKFYTPWTFFLNISINCDVDNSETKKKKENILQCLLLCRPPSSAH